MNVILSIFENVHYRKPNRAPQMENTPETYFNKVKIVILSHTVINIHTMVVKFICAPITLAAVMGQLLYI